MPSKKSCPPGKVRLRNGRCYKKCKPEQIRNPKTMRCVKRSGKIGKAILAQKRRAKPNEQQLLQRYNAVLKQEAALKRRYNAALKRQASLKRSAKQQKGGCREKKTKRYQNPKRNAPPFPATACCKAGVTILPGKNGKPYEAVERTRKNGKKYCTWVKHGTF